MMDTIESIESIVHTNNRLNSIMDEPIDAVDDTEEGEILEDGEIADDDNDQTVPKKEEVKHEEKENKSKDTNNRDITSSNGSNSNNRERKRDTETSVKRDRERARDRDSAKDKTDKDKDKHKEDKSDKSDKERRHSYDRNADRNADRDRKSDERDRKSSADDEREKRRRERERKRRRSDEDDEREKRLLKRKDGWPDGFERPAFDEYGRRNFEQIDFRLKDGPFLRETHASITSDDDEDMPFDDRDLDDMMLMMDTRAGMSRVSTSIASMDGLPNDKRSMMRAAMALVMKRNIDMDKTRRMNARSRQDKRQRARDRQPGPTGTRANRQAEHGQSLPNSKTQCKFFIEGKCHKGSECSYSHDCTPAKKKEICKFYLQGFCGKGEDCLYMHNEFPCKFFHTNVECYSGENCRFSHEPLTEDTRNILRNYLDSGQLPDDPKPDRNETPIAIDANHGNSNNMSHHSNSSSSSYAPMKPVPKRFAILGDATGEMKGSYFTWVWQQEMKELEVAYVGNKRNLFCIEKQFVMNEKPPTPRMEDDEEEIEAQIRSYYLDTMGSMDGLESEEIATPTVKIKTEEQKLIEASAHDEDLRTYLMRPKSSAVETNDSVVINREIISDSDLMDESLQMTNDKTSALQSSANDVKPDMAQLSHDMYTKMQTKSQNESESKSSWLSDSDDDDKDEHVLAAALKNVERKSQTKANDSADKSNQQTIDITKMLSAIRQSTSQASSSAPSSASKQTEFWQNILSGINLAGNSPSDSNTPPRGDYRDPRLKRGRDSPPTADSSPAVKICDPSVYIEYKLLPITVSGIDYSCYVSIYRIDSRLKNDPRLQKFFSKLPSSEIDNLSRIVPPPLKTAPVTPLSVLKSLKRNERERKESHKKAKTSSPSDLPPLPPLTMSPTKTAPTPGIIPPTPPPIMSPLELISSRPTFTVGESTAVKIEPNIDAYLNAAEVKPELSEPSTSPTPLTTKSYDESPKESEPLREWKIWR